MKIIDAFGKQCPLPLVLAKKELDSGCREFAVRVDNETAVENLSRLARRSKMSVAVDAVEGGWLVGFDGDGVRHKEGLSMSWDGSSGRATCEADGCGYAVFISSDSIGTGDAELGVGLMKMALWALSEAQTPPESLLFMNEGVKLLVEGQDQNIESVRRLVSRGAEVLVCGTCLDFYHVKDKLAVGEVSNMYDILERMREAAKTITL